MSERRLRLSGHRVREIRALVDLVLRQIKCSEPSVPVETVARRLGAEVLFAPYEGDDLAGMLVHRAGKPLIAVNSSHHKNRQRFTIAHECGHLLLGHKGDAYVDKSFEIHRDAKSTTATDIFEVEANQFAAELLMPTRFLLKDMPTIDFEDDEKIVALATRYGVSVTAMSYRIANVFM